MLSMEEHKMTVFVPNLTACFQMRVPTSRSCLLFTCTPQYASYEAPGGFRLAHNWKIDYDRSIKYVWEKLAISEQFFGGKLEIGYFSLFRFLGRKIANMPIKPTSLTWLFLAFLFLKFRRSLVLPKKLNFSKFLRLNPCFGRCWIDSRG